MASRAERSELEALGVDRDLAHELPRSWISRDGLEDLKQVPERGQQHDRHRARVAMSTQPKGRVSGAAEPSMVKSGGISSGYCASAQPQKINETCSPAPIRASRNRRNQSAASTAIAVTPVARCSGRAQGDASSPAMHQRRLAAARAAAPGADAKKTATPDPSARRRKSSRSS